MTNPWNRRKDEPDSAWEAFQIYRDLGPGERSTAKTAQMLSKSKRTTDGWSGKWAWVERARAWDMHLDEAVQKRVEAEMGEMAVRHVRAGQNLQNVSTVIVQEWARRLKADEVDLSQVPIEVLNKLTKDSAFILKTGVDIERLAVGASTEKVEVSAEEEHVHRLREILKTRQGVKA